MKKMLVLVFTCIASWATNLLSVSDVYLTNNTDLEFDVKILQTAGAPLPDWAGNRDAVSYKNDKIPANLPQTKLYSIPRNKKEAQASAWVGKTYCFGVQLNRDKSYIAFNQKIVGVTGLLQDSDMCNSASATPPAYPSALQDTTNTGPRLMRLIEQTSQKDICVIYDRVSSFLGHDDIYITLSYVDQVNRACPGPTVPTKACPGECGK